MRGTFATLALSLALAACGQGSSGGGNVASVRLANPQSEQLKGMSEIYRNLGLRRAIMDSGQRCKKSEGGAYQQDYKNMAMWTTHCVDSGDWAIFISPGGEVQVRKCTDAASLGLPPCQRSAPTAGDPSAAKKGR
ncbi:MAG: hypothetical protein JO013_08325 [Alphaproteobacteria bacterium]|nr:hypothetical protein [Alphaproteobacteria bacterium]